MWRRQLVNMPFRLSLSDPADTRCCVDSFPLSPAPASTGGISTERVLFPVQRRSLRQRDTGAFRWSPSTKPHGRYPWTSYRSFLGAMLFEAVQDRGMRTLSRLKTTSALCTSAQRPELCLACPTSARCTSGQRLAPLGSAQSSVRHTPASVLCNSRILHLDARRNPGKPS